MDVREIARLLRRRWVATAILVLLGLGLAAGYVILATPNYVASAEVFVSTQSASDVTDLSAGNTFTQEVVKSYADVASSPFVLDEVIAKLRLKTTAELLAEDITAVAPTNTVVLQIEVSNSSPQLAARIANGIAEQLTTAVSTLSPSTGGAGSPVKITQIQRATPPAVPDSPRLGLSLALGGTLGLIAGVLLALAIDRLDVRLRGISDVRHITQHAILGGLTDYPEAVANPVAVQRDSQDVRAEGYRTLRTNLQFVDLDTDVRVIVISSSIGSEGKSTTAVNLAAAIAQAGQRVVLVDADLRKPVISGYLGIEGGVGLTDVLIGEVPLEEALQDWGDGYMKVLPAGTLPPNPSELLQSAAMGRLLDVLKSQAEYILLDAPPVLPVSDAAILTRSADGALLIAAAGRVTKPQLRNAIAALSQVNARVLGVVVTMLPARGAYSYGYGAYGGYGYESELDRAQVSRAQNQNV